MTEKTTEPVDGRAATIEELVAESELTELSLRTIELYQTQGQLLDRLWAYFSQYSAVMILLGLVAVPFKITMSSVPAWLLALPLLAYLALCFAGHLAMRLSIDELHLLRQVAIQKTRLPFAATSKGNLLKWHFFSMLLTIGIYVTCWTYVKWPVGN